MLIKKIKDNLYYYFVQKNALIANEYEWYVDNHIDEHRVNRMNSWLLLAKLNFHYRILRRRTPLIRKQESNEQKRNNVKLPYLDGSESKLLNRLNPLFFAQELLKYDVISFDIFDTLVLRPFAKPSDLFMLVGSKLKCVDFVKIRIDAEKKAREMAYVQKGNYEVDIFDIYSLIERRTGINKEYGARVEFETELELCFANPYMERVFKLLKGQGKTVIAISDMYLSNDMLTKLLDRCGYQGIDRIYVSCEYNCSKSSGGLYKVVQQELQNRTMIHIGDNYESDIKMAGKLNISTKYYKNVHEAGNPFRADGMSELIGSAYAGIINTYLHNGVNQYNPYYEYGFIYGGLYILGFCNWIYRKAKREGVNKVLFLARDGDIYQRVFNIMFSDMPNEYLYWSRIANNKYTLSINRDDFLTRMVYHKAIGVIPLTISDILKSLSLTDLISKLSKYNLREDTLLVKENVKVIEDFFISNWDHVINAYENQGRHVYGYIKQKIGNSKKVAIIDVGWLGSGPLGLKYLIEQEMNTECKVCCWLAASCSYNPLANINELMNEDIEAYMFSRMLNRNLYDVHAFTNKGTNNIFLELFTQAVYPSFSGFNDEGNFIFDIPEVENYSIIKDIHNGIIDFVKEYIDKFNHYEYMFNISGYDAYLPYRMIIRDPTFLKKHFSSIRFSRGVSGDHSKQRIETIGQILESVGL